MRTDHNGRDKRGDDRGDDELARARGLYERLTGRGAEISYTFQDMEVQVPSGTGDDAEHAEWHLDGTIRVTTRERE